MKIFGIIGWKNAGKTTLIVRLIEEFRKRGLTVSTLKHAHHNFDIDKPGKDSHRHRQAGAREVLVASSRRWALIHEHESEAEPDLDALLPHLSAVDLVLVEGFKRYPHPKIEVVLKGSEGPLIALEDPMVRAVVTNDPTMKAPVPVLDIDDVASVADFVLTAAGLKPLKE